MTESTLRRAAFVYSSATLCVVSAFGVAALLGKWAEPDYTALYALSILVAASLGGRAGGLWATALAAIGTPFAQVGWTGAVDLGWDDGFRVGVFIVIAVVVSSIVARQHSTELKLQESVRRLREADQAKDSFLAGLSHELRTPLTSILGWSAILTEPGLEESTIAEAAESIRQSARSQQYLIDDLLDLSRIIFERFHLELCAVDLVLLAREALDLIRPVAQAKGVAVTIQLPKHPCVIEADAQRVKQVIWNLLSNAVKFTPSQGAVELRVELGATEAVVVVSDTGEGIEPDALSRIFDRFEQGTGAMRKGGLGLGLAIARHVVEAHHGSMVATSEGLGKGSTFRVRFPLA